MSVEDLSKSLSQLSLQDSTFKRYPELPSGCQRLIASFVQNPIAFFRSCKTNSSDIMVITTLCGRGEFLSMAIEQGKETTRFIQLFLQSERGKNSISFLRISPEKLTFLNLFPQLRAVEIRSFPNDTNLQQMPTLPQLQTLTLDQPRNVTVPTLKQVVQKMEKLESLTSTGLGVFKLSSGDEEIEDELLKVRKTLKIKLQ